MSKKLAQANRAIEHWSRMMTEAKRQLPWWVAIGRDDMVKYISGQIVMAHRYLMQAQDRQSQLRASRRRRLRIEAKKEAEYRKLAQFAP